MKIIRNEQSSFLINYYCINTYSGYSQAAKDYIFYLNDRNININFIPVNTNEEFDISDYRDIEVNKLRKYNNIPKGKNIIHTPPDRWNKEIKRFNIINFIGYFAIESEIIPDYWIDILKKANKLIVPSEWNKKVIDSYDIGVNCYSVPHIPRKEKIVIDKRFDFLNDEKVNFYTIGEWNERKGIEENIRAYIDAMNRYPKLSDLTRLVVKTNNSNAIRYQNFGGLNIEVYTNFLTEGEIFSLHSQCDCFISLCKSEGFGMSKFYASMFGNPVITTNYSAHTEFLREDQNYLLDYEIDYIRGMNNVKWFKNYQTWAIPDFEQAVSAIITFSKAPFGNHLSRVPVNYMEKYNLDNIVSKFENIIKDDNY